MRAFEGMCDLRPCDPFEFFSLLGLRLFQREGHPGFGDANRDEGRADGVSAAFAEYDELVFARLRTPIRLNAQGRFGLAFLDRRRAPAEPDGQPRKLQLNGRRESLGPARDNPEIHISGLDDRHFRNDGFDTVGRRFGHGHGQAIHGVRVEDDIVAAKH